MRVNVLLSLLLTFAVCGVAAAESPAVPDWDQWRGPQRTGAVPGDSWPASLEGLVEMWSVDLGKGYPGPIVTESLVFVVETVDRKTVAARALSREDGAEVWKTTWGGSGSVPFFAASNGDWVRSTPAWDGKTLYVGDMNEKLLALAGDSGEIRWTVDFPALYKTKIPDFGFASSPLLDGEFLYVQAANSIVKLNATTGKPIWRSLAGTSKMSESGAFSSPVIETLAGVRQLVVMKRGGLFGVSLEDGTELWSQPVPNFRGMNILTPVIEGDRIFTSPYKNGAFLYEVTRSGEGFKVDEVWTHKATGYMSTPVEIDGFVYMHLSNGRLSCLEIATGEERWRTENLGKYWSMAWQGDKILALDSGGELLLVRANPEGFELLDRKSATSREAWAHLAVRGNEVFVRDLTSIRAFRWSLVD
ncbi:MAG: PQQ-like beta-propeller repeat protein [Acidobacteriota bacterium]|nr:PQQ-like beta-propeller repeat protein [Acidobacteriota bacterium]